MRLTLYILAITTVLLLGCKKNNNYNKPHDPKDKPVAKAYDKYLYLSEIEKIVPNGVSPDDSLLYAERYINEWIKEQLLAHVALQYISDEQMEQINRKVEDFKNSLLIHSFKQQIISQKLDTNISVDLISQYYETHKQDFVLQQPAVRGFWFYVPLTSENLTEIRSLAFSDSEEDFMVLKDLVAKSDGKFVDFTHNWKYFSDVIINIPTVISDVNYFLKYRQQLQTQDDYKYYFLKILEYKPKGDYIPLQLCQQEIKQIILKRRSDKLITTIEKQLYDQAIKKGDIKIFQ